jgi:hypothetical protein
VVGRQLKTPGLALGLGLLSSCVQYQAVEIGALPPAQEVRVHVTDEGALRLARHLGRITDDVTASVAPQNDSIALTVWLGKDYPGTQFENVRETILLPQDEVTSVRVRKLSTWRTAALSIGVLAGALVLADQISQIGDPNRQGDDDNPPPPAGITLLRILFRRFP